MADKTTELKFKLTIDNKEVTAVLDLTKGEFVETGAAATAAQEKIQNAYKNLSSEASKYNTVTDASVAALFQFIKAQDLSVDMIEKTIIALKNETDSLPVNSAAWQQKMAAADNLKIAMGKVVTEHVQLGNAQHATIPGVNNMTMAIGQLGWVLGDANMFMVNMRMGMMSVANNIPMVVQAFLQARDAAALTGTTIKQQLTAALVGGGGLMLGINALMLVMQLLPALFDDTSKAADKQTDAIKKLKDEYAKLTKEQINNYIQTREEELRKIEAAHPTRQRDVYDPETRKRIDTRSMTDKEIYGSDLERKQKLDDEIKSLKETQRDLGLIENIRNRITVNQDQLNKLNENEASPFYYKNIIKTAKSYEDAKTTLDKWIEADQKKIKSIETNNNRELNAAKQLAEDKARIMAEIAKEGEKDKAKEWTSTATRDELNDELILKLSELAKNEMAILGARNKEALQKQKEYRDILKNDVDAINAALDDLDKGDEAAAKKALDNRGKRSERQKQWREEKEKFESELPSKTASDPTEKQKLELDLEEELTLKRADLYGATEEQKTNIQNYYSKQREAIERQSMFNTVNNTSQMLGQLAALFGKQTAAYKVLASAQVMIETYKGVMALYAPPPIGVGPLLAPFMTGIVLATGIANVANIMKQDTTMKGFETGGRLPQGKMGFFEGTHNEIVAPEEDFMTVAHQLIGSSIVEARNYFNGTGGSENSNLLKEINLLNKNFEKYASTPTPAFIRPDEFNRAFNEADYDQRKSVL